METTAFHSFKLQNPLNYSDLWPSSTCFSVVTVFPQYTTANVLGFNCFERKLYSVVGRGKQLKSIRAISSSSNSADDVQKWLLEPIGDGNTKHIGFKTKMPGAFQLNSKVVTVGRVPEKADVVLPVPTVSGVHARIQRTEKSLVITDLDSTNGTFIDEKRLTPGVAATALPGSKIIFGDANLAIFRVSKIDSFDATTNGLEIEEAETEEEEDKPLDT